MALKWRFVMEHKNNFIEQRMTLASYTSRTFGWMFFGLVVTFVLAFTTYSTGFIFNILSIPGMIYIIPIAEILLVIVFSSRIYKLPIVAAHAIFFTYAVLNGLTFSIYFLIFDLVSMIYVFAATAGLFGVMAVYGFVTKSDLSKWRRVLVFGLIILAAFWVFSIFINLSALETVACMFGIIIFIGLTAYDTQKIKLCYEAYYDDPQMLEKASIYSALQLYLDFINLFVYILRLFGRRR